MKALLEDAAEDASDPLPVLLVGGGAFLAPDSSVFVAEIDIMSLQHIANQIRIIVKAVGDVDLNTNAEAQTKGIEPGELDG